MPLSRLRRLLRGQEGPAESPPPAVDEPVADHRNARYDTETIEVIDRVLGPGDAALDVGANEGSILEGILRRSPDGQHHAFEPLPALADALRVRFPTVTVHQCALAAEQGRATFHHVVTNPSYSGLRERRYNGEGEQVELITVSTERLDDVIAPDVAVRFVKIDVEGGELGVLRGGVELLARHRPIVVFEHGLGAADYYGTRPEQILEVFDACDYGVTLMADWLAGGIDLSHDAFIEEFELCRNYYFLAHPR